MVRLPHLALSHVLPIAAASLTATALFAGAAAAAVPGTAVPSGSGATALGLTGFAVRADAPAWATATADRGPVADSDVLPARVGLAGRDPAGLAAFARAVSTPGDARYRRFLTPAQAAARFGPTAAQTAAVRAWLTGAGLTVTGANQHWIDVSGPASALRRAFGVRIDRYATPGTRPRRAPSGPATVPARLAGAVSGISGLTEVVRGSREGATGAAQAEEALGRGPQPGGTAREGASGGRTDESAPRGFIHVPMVPGAVREGASAARSDERASQPGAAREGASAARPDERASQPGAAQEGASGARLDEPAFTPGAASEGATGARQRSRPLGAATSAAQNAAPSADQPSGPIEPGTVGSEAATAAAPAPAPAPPTTQPCSPDWGRGTLPAVGYPTGYASAEPLDLCGYQPSQLRGAYGVTATGLTGQGVKIAVVDAYASPTMRADADTYATRHGDRPFAQGQYQEYVDQSKWTHTTDGVCQTPSDWSGEEALDVEMAHGLAPDATVRYFGANSCTDTDLTATMATIVDGRLADLVTGSFGETMHQTTGDIEPAVVAQENQIFQKGAAEGIGFNVSSGDCGDDAAKLTGPNCDPQSARAQTEWPASSPWVTAVGGTALAATRGGAYQWETNMGDRRSVLTADGKAWDPFPGFFYFGGGGGTSEDFAQPSYQAGVVPDAMARTLATGARSSKPMRTVPDVAMNGDLLTAIFVGQTDPATGQYAETQVGGTSASAPMFAAMLADAMQGARRPFGFVNPTLYRRARSGLFTDVVDHPAAAPNPVSTVLDLGLNTDGSRKVRLYELGQDHGLTAVAGYDEATGLGSPRRGFLTSLGR